MEVRVAGRSREIPEGTTVLGLLELLAVPIEGTAVEVDGEIVPRSRYETTALRPGQVVELVRFVGGG